VISYYGIDELTWTGFFVKEGSPIRGPRDFIGKRVAMNTLGAHSEFVLREYLTRGGLTPQELQQVTMLVVPPINAEQSLRQDQLEIAAMLGIFRDKALERGGLRLVFSDHDLFGTFSAGSYVFSLKKLREWPNTIRKFVEATGRAIEWTRAQPAEVVRQRMAAIITRRGRGEDPSLVQHWKSTAISQPGGRIADSEFQVWIDWLIKDGQLAPGQVTREQLYTNEFNAYGKAAEARLDP
jgi:ABC-type nitrate/sulfonate/bicarbonate transport system substrate-binding protein